jgi:hypothetical protein
MGSYVVNTDKDVRNRDGLAWAAFDRLRPILQSFDQASRSDKPQVSLKIRLFNMASLSILLYGCENWVLTDKQAKDLDVFPKTCYRIMLGISLSESHMTNEQLYKLAKARLIS